MKHFVTHVVKKKVFTCWALVKVVEIIIVLSDYITTLIDHLSQTFDDLLILILFLDWNIFILIRILYAIHLNKLVLNNSHRLLNIWQKFWLPTAPLKFHILWEQLHISLKNLFVELTCI